MGSSNIPTSGKIGQKCGTPFDLVLDIRRGSLHAWNSFPGYHVSLPNSATSTLASILRHQCPRCRIGRIFRSNIYWGFPKMNDRCPACGLLFDREPGYFLGAMYISYGLGIAVIVAFGAAFWALTDWPWKKIGLWAIVLFLPLAPMVTYLARVLWIYLDQSIDPERK